MCARNAKRPRAKGDSEMRESKEIKGSYLVIKSINIGTEAIKQGRVMPGPFKVLVRAPSGDVDVVEGTLNGNGVLSGMSKLFARLGLQGGSQIHFRIIDTDRIEVASDAELAPAQTGVGEPGRSTPRRTVSQRQSLRHVHFEQFRPENLESWKPETETDVFLAFGVLQNYTDFRYCCGTNTSVLGKLNYRLGKNQSKPDAVVIHVPDDEYMIAEFKIRSLDFAKNHKPEEVDVLIAWEADEDEADAKALPAHVLCLKDIARAAAKEVFEAEPT